MPLGWSPTGLLTSCSALIRQETEPETGGVWGVFCRPVTKRAGGEGEALVQDGAGRSRLPRYLVLPFERRK